MKYHGVFIVQKPRFDAIMIIIKIIIFKILPFFQRPVGYCRARDDFLRSGMNFVTKDTRCELCVQFGTDERSPETIFII